MARGGSTIDSAEVGDELVGTFASVDSVLVGSVRVGFARERVTPFFYTLKHDPSQDSTTSILRFFFFNARLKIKVHF